MKYLYGLLWLLSIGIAFKLGTYLNQSITVGEFEQQFEQSDSRSGNQANDQSEPSFFSFSSEHNSSDALTEPRPLVERQQVNQSAGHPSDVDLEDTIVAVNRLLLNSSAMNMSKLAKAYNLVQQLDKSQLLNAMYRLDPNTTDPKQMKLLSLFLSRYAELEPTEAIAYVDRNISASTTKRYGHSTVLTAWAETDPTAALEWYKNNASAELMNQRNSGLFGIFDGLARQDVNLAMDNLEQFSDSPKAMSSAVSGLAYSLSSEQDFTRLLDKTKDLDNNRLTQSVVSMWARKDPEQALTWVSNVEDDKQQNELEQRLFRTWLYADADVAADRYMARADSTNMQSRAQFVAKSLSYASPEKAMNWINQQPEIDAQPLLEKLVQRSTYRNPDFAAKHLELLQDKKDVIAKSVSIYMSFERSSQNKAENFLAASDYKSEVAEAIAERKERQNKRKKKD